MVTHVKVAIRLATVMLLLAFTNGAFAQRTISGTVKDAANGTTIPGVNVAVKGAKGVGTATSIDGTFTIKLPNGPQTLVVSFIGYTTQEVAVTNQTKIDVLLQPATQKIDEVVVTALGIKREKKALGYAVTELKGSSVEKIQVSSPAAALQGKVSGLQIDQTAGSGVTSTPRVTLRGAKSLTGNDQPIWVVDGVVMENTPFAGTNNWRGNKDFGNQLANLNMDDFESISVLKGAAAATLYGSRGLNGAIVVTTKKGVKKGIGVDFSATFTRDKIYDSPADLQDTYGVGTPIGAYSKYDGYDINYDKSQAGGLPLAVDIGQSFGPRMNGQKYIRDGIGYSDALLYTPQTNNWKALYQDGTSKNYNVAVSGGSDNVNYRLSYSNNTSEGVFKRNSFDKNTITFNGGGKINDYITAQVSASYSSSTRKNPALQGNWDYGNNIGYALIAYMTRDVDLNFWKSKYVQPDGTVMGDYPMAGTFFFLDYNNAEMKDNSLISSIELNGKIFQNDKFVVDLTGRANFNLYETHGKNWNPDDSNVLTGVARAYYGQSFSSSKSYTYNTFLHFKHNVTDRFNYDVRFGSEVYGDFDGYSGAMGTNGGLKVPGIYRLSNSKNPITSGSYSISQHRNRVVGVYGFANFSYKDEYFLELAGRNDYNSTMLYTNGNGNYSYFYPAVSGSWLFTETFKDALPEWFSLGKIRASYGVTGRGYDAYRTNIGYTNSTIFTPTGGGTSAQTQISPSQLPSMNLKPEMNYQKEVGAELHFFNNRLHTDVTLYRSNTKNQIMTINLPVEGGASSRPINAGNFQNTGMEFSLSGTPVQTEDWKWSIGGNISFNRGKVISFYPGQNMVVLSNDWNQGDLEVRAYTGGDFGVIVSGWGAEAYNGTNTANHGKRVIVADGSYDWKFKRAADAKEKYKYGSIEPKFIGGINSDVSWKSLSLSTALQFRKGGYIYSTTSQFGTNVGNLASTTKWREDGLPRVSNTVKDANGNFVSFNDGVAPDAVFADGTILKASNPNNLTGADQNIGGMTYKEAYEKGIIKPWQVTKFYAQQGSWSRAVIDNASDNGLAGGIYELSYVAVRDITLSYVVPKSIISKAAIRGLSVYFSVQNPFYLYNSLPDNINPDGVFRSSNSFMVTEWGGSPYSRKFIFGLNVSL